MSTKLGRPPVPDSQRKRSVTFSLTTPELKRIEKLATQHGVSRSQIVWDAISALEGSLHETIATLRAELRDQQRIKVEMEARVMELNDNLVQLQKSQEIVDAVLNPHDHQVSGKMTKTEKDRIRVVRVFVNTPHLKETLLRLSPHADSKVLMGLPGIFMEGRAAFGSIEALRLAVEEALKVAKQ